MCQRFCPLVGLLGGIGRRSASLVRLLDTGERFVPVLTYSEPSAVSVACVTLPCVSEGGGGKGRVIYSQKVWETIWDERGDDWLYRYK